MFNNGAWRVSSAGVTSLRVSLPSALHIPTEKLLDTSEGMYAWPIRLASMLGNADFELFVDAFRAAISLHRATAVDSELLQHTIETARLRLKEGKA